MCVCMRMTALERDKQELRDIAEVAVLTTRAQVALKNEETKR
jgi:hypothetical protein